MSTFAKLGDFASSHARRILWAAAIVLAFGIGVLIDGGRLTAATIHGLEASAANAELDAITQRPEASTLAVVLQARDPGPLAGLSPMTPEFAAAQRLILDRVRAIEGVAEVTTATEAPALLAERMRNKQAHAEVAFITFKGEVDDAIPYVPALREALKSNDLSAEFTGNLAFVVNLAEVLEHDLLRAELISLPLALLVLLYVFRTGVAAALPVLVGALAVISGIAFVMLLSYAMPIAQYTINVCSLIGFGVAIDYSLFLVSRYRDELAAGKDYPEALRIAVSTAGRAVLFAGFAVGVGLAGLLFFEGSYLSVMGLGGSIVVLFAMLFALTVLPALLSLLGPKIHLGKLPGVGLRRDTGGWARLARAVMRRPLLVLVPTLLLLGLCARPAADMRLAATDVSVLPETTEARRGLTALEQHFPELAEERVLIAVRFPEAPVLTEARIGALYDLTKRLQGLTSVQRVDGIVPTQLPGLEDEPPMQLERADAVELLTQPNELGAATLEEAKRLLIKEHVTVLHAILDKQATPAERDALVHAIRSERGVGDGALIVGGKAAHDVDSTEFMVSRAPRAVVFVIGVTLVVVFALLRSILLPLKAVAMNILSIGATFGGLVWIFQYGNLFIADGHPLEPTLPVLLFCVSFGLSMDYEVLMMARMKEAYDRSGDNTTAVAEGLERSAGLITSAAAIMVSVFAAFALANVVVLQATGVGLALAVALDATLIRALLVPSTMRLLGAWNWWPSKPAKPS